MHTPVRTAYNLRCHRSLYIRICEDDVAKRTIAVLLQRALIPTYFSLHLHHYRHHPHSTLPAFALLNSSEVTKCVRLCRSFLRDSNRVCVRIKVGIATAGNTDSPLPSCSSLAPSYYHSAFSNCPASSCPFSRQMASSSRPHRRRWSSIRPTLLHLLTSR